MICSVVSIIVVMRFVMACRSWRALGRWDAHDVREKVHLDKSQQLAVGKGRVHNSVGDQRIAILGRNFHCAKKIKDYSCSKCVFLETKQATIIPLRKVFGMQDMTRPAASLQG